VLQSLADLGRQLGVPSTQELTQAASLVIDALSSTSLRWLLVYDNANEPDDLAHLIPSAGGHVILTSRNQTWSNVWDAIEVNVFDRAESVALVQKRGNEIAFADANRLAEKLGDLPLALDQAASWQAATGMPVSDYLDLFDEHHRVLLTEGKPTGYPTTIAALVKLAYQRLQHDYPGVAQLLEMFAVLGAEPISLDLLRWGRNADIPDPLGPALKDKIALGRIVRDLRKFGLASVDMKNRIQVHRLFQLVLRDELGEDQLRQSRTNVHRLLGAANPGEPDDDATHRAHAEIAPHVLPSGLIAADSEDARRVVLDQIRYLWIIGDYDGSRRLGEAAVPVWEKRADQPDLGPDGELTLLATRHLAATLISLGITDRARELAERALTRLRENPAFGADHEHSLFTADVLAVVQRVVGEYELALTTDRENVERHQRVFGDEDPQTLRNRGNLAVNLRMLSDFPGAYEIDSDNVRRYEETLNEQDRSLLLAQTNLARDLYGLGRYTEALSLQARIMPTYRRTMRNPKHPEILLAARTQAIAMRKTGQYAEALRAARENYRDTTARYGDSHQSALAATMTYANTLRVSAELGEARGLALEAMNRYRRVFGEKHPLTLTAMVNLAIILRSLGDLAEARRLDENAHSTMVATLGAEHGYTLCAASGLANDLAMTDETEAAQRLSAATLAISRQSRGERHPYTLLCAVNAGFDLVATGEAEQGQIELAAAIEALADLLGPTHPDTLDAQRGKRAECDIEPPPT
jgi:tetratricopeptide (TPR) repeat protein